MSWSREGPREPAKDATSQLPANEYAQLCGFKGSATVKVLIGEQKQVYTIPKALLTKHSEFFRAAFENNFVEGIEQVCTLEDAEVEPFELLLQWIGTGDLILPSPICWSSDEVAEETEKVTLNGSEGSWGDPTGESWGDPTGETQNAAVDGQEFSGFALAPLDTTHVRAAHAKFSRYLEFLLLADRLMVSPDPVKFVERKMQALCNLNVQIEYQSSVEYREYRVAKPMLIDLLDSSMITKVWQLSSGHPIRELLAEACTENYIDCHIRGSDWTNRKFKFTEEIDSVPGFGIQLMRTVTQVLVHPQREQVSGNRFRIRSNNAGLGWDAQGFLINPDVCSQSHGYDARDGDLFYVIHPISNNTTYLPLCLHSNDDNGYGEWAG